MLKTTVRGCVGFRTNSRKSVRISTVFRKHNNKRRLEGIIENMLKDPNVTQEDIKGVVEEYDKQNKEFSFIPDTIVAETNRSTDSNIVVPEIIQGQDQMSEEQITLSPSVIENNSENMNAPNNVFCFTQDDFLLVAGTSPALTHEDKYKKAQMPNLLKLTDYSLSA